MSSYEKEHLLQLVSDCYVLRAGSASTREATYHLLDGSRIDGIVRGLRQRAGISFNGGAALVTPMELSKLDSVARRSEDARRKIVELLPEGIADDTEIDLEARISSASSMFNDVSPEVLERHLDPAASAIASRRISAGRVERAEKAEMVAALLPGWTFRGGCFRRTTNRLFPE